MAVRRILVGWYTAESWPRLRALSVDRDDLPERYEDWLEMAERRLAQLADAGWAVERVAIEPAELERWARAHGREIDGDARSDFPLWLDAQRHRHMQ